MSSSLQDSDVSMAGADLDQASAEIIGAITSGNPDRIGPLADLVLEEKITALRAHNLALAVVLADVQTAEAVAAMLIKGNAQPGFAKSLLDSKVIRDHRGVKLLSALYACDADPDELYLSEHACADVRVHFDEIWALPHDIEDPICVISRPPNAGFYGRRSEVGRVTLGTIRQNISTGLRGAHAFFALITTFAISVFSAFIYLIATLV